jgi:tRNA(Ile)-lysidine synthase
VIAAHFNHGLRGADSDLDQAFVEDLGNRLGIAVKTGQACDESRSEAGLRRQRLDFLTSTAETCGARYVALAHSADDDVETVLHHLLRGTGPAGLAGIRPFRPLAADLVLARPLLGCSRAQIRQALVEIGQTWREDASNRDLEYRRNWIRHQLLPVIESKYPEARAAIARAGQAQREWRQAIERLAQQWLADHRTGRDPVDLACDRLGDPPILIAACQTLWDTQQWPRGEMSRPQWLRLAESIRGQRDAPYTLPGNIRVTVICGHVRLQREPAPASEK